MDRQIIWTPQAENTLTQIVEYLEQNWTEREIQKLFLRIDKTVSPNSSAFAMRMP